MVDLINCMKKSNRKIDLIDAKKLETLKNPKKLNARDGDTIFPLEK